MNHPIKHTKPIPRKKQRRSTNQEAGIQEANRRYPFRVPSSLSQRIDWNNPQDPLHRQFMPSAEEMLSVAGFTTDPLAEERARHTTQDSLSPAYIPGLLQKYHGRVLLQLSGECAIHCRFCFRRHDDYADIPKNREEWSPALALIARDTSLREVIFSGGDPLMLADNPLATLVHRLAMIPHLKRVRVHSRMPIVTPKRVGSALIRWMTETRLTPIMVIHCNHPAELDNAALAAIARLVDAGIPVLSQSVLLKGVNDDAHTLALLYEKLINHRVMPYYLHLLDKVAGAAHFQVTETVARTLIIELQARLPGYAIPRLVWEQAGAPSKTPIASLP